MNRGYIILGVDDYGKQQNITCAYALSLSLKLLEKECKTCVVVAKFSDVPENYEHAFDFIIELPFGRTENNHSNIFIDFWQLYHCTPFDETIFINTFSLALENIDNIWDVASADDLVFSNCLDFRTNPAKANNEIFQKNQLPELSSNMVFFRQGPLADNFFKMADPVFKEWREVYREVHTQSRLDDFDLKVMLNTVIKLLSEQFISQEYFSTIDLDITPDTLTEWSNSHNIWFTTDLRLKVNNYRQAGIVVYNEPGFLTAGMLKKVNDYYNKAQKQIRA